MQSLDLGGALCDAIRSLDIPAIDRLLESGGLSLKSLDFPNDFENPPIALACMSHEPEHLVLPVVRRLIDAGFDVDACNYSPGAFEHTPLMIAVIKNRIELVRLLMDHGANPELEDRNYENVLQMAIHAQPQTLDALLESLKIRFGQQEFVEFANRGNGALYEAALFGRETAVNALVREGADLEGLNKSGQTPLQSVAKICTDVMAARGLMQLVRLGAIVTTEVWMSQPGRSQVEPRQFSPPEGMWALMLTVEPAQWPGFASYHAGFMPGVPVTPLAAAMHLGDNDILMEMASKACSAQEISQMQCEAQHIHECSGDKGVSRCVGSSFALLSAQLSRQLIGRIVASKAPKPL